MLTDEEASTLIDAWRHSARECKRMADYTRDTDPRLSADYGGRARTYTRAADMLCKLLGGDHADPA